jgi:hypothetical protein
MKTRIPAGLLLALLAAPAILIAQDQVTVHSPGQSLPRIDATVQMTGKLVAVGIGYAWGRGVIDYQGADQPFCIHGLSVGDVGFVRLQSDGVVLHLNSLDDFAGKYFAISTGVAIAGGESAALLKNDHGVTLQLETKMRGLRVSLAVSSIRITLAGQHGCKA